MKLKTSNQSKDEIEFSAHENLNFAYSHLVQRNKKRCEAKEKAKKTKTILDKEKQHKKQHEKEKVQKVRDKISTQLIKEHIENDATKYNFGAYEYEERY